MNSMTNIIQSEWTAEDKKTIPPQYSCEILLENTTPNNANDTSFPSDAYIVYYKVNDKLCIDVCRGAKVNIFDMYYDRFGIDSVQKITWGNGRINPSIWGQKVQQPKTKKRK